MDLNKEIINCRKCERLVAWREEVATIKRKAYKDFDYWGKPVPGFGDINGQVLVVGLAPGAHGSNRTGRMFTGDASGDFLFPALNRAGFSSQTESLNLDDGLKLNNLFITAVCRCVPPDNKPTSEEISTCLPYLKQEISMMGNLKVVVALGLIAHNYLMKIFSELSGSKVNVAFKHGQTTKIDALNIFFISSYHPSRQNTQTGRLTIEMFDQIWNKTNLAISETIDYP